LYKTLIRFSKDFHTVGEYFAENEDMENEYKLTSSRSNDENPFQPVSKKAGITKAKKADIKPKIEEEPVNVYYTRDNEMFYSMLEDEELLISRTTDTPKTDTKLKTVTFDPLPKIINLPKLNFSKFYDPVYDYKRFKLPVPRKKVSLNIWSILKDAVGKDLSKFTVPGKNI
jgi:hypothetical protein